MPDNRAELLYSLDSRSFFSLDDVKEVMEDGSEQFANMKHLYWSFRRGEEICEYILSKMNPEIVEKKRNEILLSCCSNGFFKLTKDLLESGGDINTIKPSYLHHSAHTLLTSSLSRGGMGGERIYKIHYQQNDPRVFKARRKCSGFNVCSHE